VVHLRHLHDKHGDRAQFLFVYIREAGHLLPEALRDFRDFTEPDDPPPGSRNRLKQRVRAGRDLFGLRFPCLLDNEQMEVQYRYSAFPRRMLVVDATGRIVVDSGNFMNDPFPHERASDWLDHYDPSSRLEEVAE
jgi:hypothetical protein